MSTNNTPLEDASKCADCRYAINITGKCSYHDLPIADAMKLSCEDKAKDFADGTSRPRTKPFKKSTHLDIPLYGFLTVCGGVLFLLAIFLFFFSDDEGWRGIWGVIGFFFLGGLGALCFYGSAKHLKEAFAEKRKAAAQKEP